MWMRITVALVTALVVGSASAALAEVNQQKSTAPPHMLSKK